MSLDPESANLDLPEGVRLFERGWLSSNSILFVSDQEAVLVDSGYASHAHQTLALVRAALGSRPLDRLLNTHLHSDHCGGNALLQATYPQLVTAIPPGSAPAVRDWDLPKLSFLATGQSCSRFRFDALLRPQTTVQLAGLPWQVHGSPGHDADSVVLFQPQYRVLVSADALWQNGFGVVFEELEGGKAFTDVAATLDLIERLAPAIVLPGHGPAFTCIPQALAAARKRLQHFISAPDKHAHYAAKVLLKFKLLELQRWPFEQLSAWAQSTPYLLMVHERFFGHVELRSWIAGLVQDLVRGGAARLEDGTVLNS